MYKVIAQSRNLIEVEIYGKKLQMGKDSVRRALFNIEVWQEGGDSFSSLLFRLIAKADFENRIKLLNSFPEYVFAYLIWFHQDDLNLDEE